MGQFGSIVEDHGMKNGYDLFHYMRGTFEMSNLSYSRCFILEKIFFFFLNREGREQQTKWSNKFHFWHTQLESLFNF